MLLLGVAGLPSAALGGPGAGWLGGSVCALLAGIDPRRHRHFSLPVGVILLAMPLDGGSLLSGALGALCLALMERARRSVRGAVLRGG